MPDLPDPPLRPADAHKGTFGTVIVVGGCAHMPGAPALTARAALRTGAGRVALAITQETLTTSLAICPSATGIPLKQHDDHDAKAIRNAAEKANAVLAIGPGWNQPSQPLLIALLQTNHPIVLDADGLNALAQTHQTLPQLRPENATTILTPHPGEFRTLTRAIHEKHPIDADPTDPIQRTAAASQLAKAHRAIVILKGQHTVIANADASRCVTNLTGNPALATAGTGDVLTGIVASLLAQGMAGFDAAQLATHLHGQAADQWAQRQGQAGLLAHELADEIPLALKSLRSQ